MVDMTDKDVLDAIIARAGGLTKAAVWLGVKNAQVINNWRVSRGIPSAQRFNVRKVANQRAGLGLPMSWLDPKKAES